MKECYCFGLQQFYFIYLILSEIHPKEMYILSHIDFTPSCLLGFGEIILGSVAFSKGDFDLGQISVANFTCT